jgi:RimJ/RimL family protein N-acetyltransferase
VGAAGESASRSRELAGGRVLLRPPVSGDAEGYVALFFEPAVAAWLRPPPLPPFSETEINEMLHDDVRIWRDGGFGPWALVEAEAGVVVGRVGLRRTSVGGELATELAWTVASDWQGQGLATESALAGIELAGELGIDSVVALVLPANSASRRVASKAGMREAGEVEHAGLPHLIYRVEPQPR